MLAPTVASCCRARGPVRPTLAVAAAISITQVAGAAEVSTMSQHITAGSMWHQPASRARSEVSEAAEL